MIWKLEVYELHVATNSHISHIPCYWLIDSPSAQLLNFLPSPNGWSMNSQKKWKTLGFIPSCWYVYRTSVVTVERFASTYRNTDIRTRKKYVNLVESVKKSGGTVHIFSSMHVSGDREYPAIIVYCIHFVLNGPFTLESMRILECNKPLHCWKCW